MRGGAGVFLLKLDAVSQSPTLARPAAPLAACVQRNSSADNTTKIHILSMYCLWIKPTKPVAPAMSLEGLQTFFRLIIYSYSSNQLCKFGEGAFCRF